MRDVWKWWGMIDRLASSDITKYEKIEKMNYIKCLNGLSYFNERDKYLNKITEQRYKNK